MRQCPFILTLLILAACNGGLTLPPDVEPGFGGTITFERSTWPPRDSLVNLWVVASQVYPLDSAAVFTGLFSNPPTVFVHPSLGETLPFFIDSVSYEFRNLPPAVYRYVSVFQRFRNEINIQSLRVVGVYSVPGLPGEPRPVTIRAYEFVPNVNIHVNFHRLPPQPF